ncbi:MAG: hypothetical protein ABI824_02955 [Acidobacteriota bacterium]
MNADKRRYLRATNWVDSVLVIAATGTGVEMSLNAARIRACATLKAVFYLHSSAFICG